MTRRTKGLARIDKNSPLAEELRKLDVEEILKADIEKICNNVSFFEMTRIMTLIVQLNSEEKRHGPMKAKLKRMIQQLIDKIEQDAGDLRPRCLAGSCFLIYNRSCHSLKERFCDEGSQ